MIIDTHAHIFPEKIADRAVENIGNFYQLNMTGKGTIDHLLMQGARAGIGGFIVNSSATVRKQVEQINRFILSAVEGRKNVWGLCALHQDMSEEEIDGELAWARENHLIGVKLHPDFQRFYIDDRAAYKIYERCEGVMPILFHTGDSRYEYSLPSRLSAVAEDFPRLQCVAAHFGGYERWEQVELYADKPNIFIDTSSSLFKLDKTRAKEIIRILGVDRVMFGVDYPMWQHSDEIERVRALGLNSGELEKVFCLNAERFYNINTRRH